MKVEARCTSDSDPSRVVASVCATQVDLVCMLSTLVGTPVHVSLSRTGVRLFEVNSQLGIELVKCLVEVRHPLVPPPVLSAPPPPGRLPNSCRPRLAAPPSSAACKMTSRFLFAERHHCDRWTQSRRRKPEERTKQIQVLLRQQYRRVPRAPVGTSSPKVRSR